MTHFFNSIFNIVVQATISSVKFHGNGDPLYSLPSFLPVVQIVARLIISKDKSDYGFCLLKFPVASISF